MHTDNVSIYASGDTEAAVISMTRDASGAAVSAVGSPRQKLIKKHKSESKKKKKKRESTQWQSEQDSSKAEILTKSVKTKKRKEEKKREAERKQSSKEESSPGIQQTQPEVIQKEKKPAKASKKEKKVKKAKKTDKKTKADQEASTQKESPCCLEEKRLELNEIEMKANQVEDGKLVADKKTATGTSASAKAEKKRKRKRARSEGNHSANSDKIDPAKDRMTSEEPIAKSPPKCKKSQESAPTPKKRKMKKPKQQPMQTENVPTDPLPEVKEGTKAVTGASTAATNGIAEAPEKAVLDSVKPTGRSSFRRVTDEEWLGKKGAWDNSYEATFGQTGWGAKAQQILSTVRGKDFRHQKTKKKRGTYFGGKISADTINSIKFESDDDGDT